MKTIHTRRESARTVLGVAAPAILFLACACTLFNAFTPAVPTPTTLPPVYPTYTLYPTYTSLPTTPSATQPIPTATFTEQPPALNPTATSTPTHTPTLTPTPTPTTTPTELPPPPGGVFTETVKSDLEITNIGPVSTTRAEKVFVDLKNNGPSAFSGKIRVVCVGHGYQRNDPAQMVPTGSDELIDITIGVGTTFFYPSMIIDVPLYFYSPIQCVIEVPDNKDPNPNNNSYSIVIP